MQYIVLHVLHTGPILRHVVAVFGLVVGGWLGGHAGDLWPNDERCSVGLNRGHKGKCLCFRLAPSNLTLDDPEGSKVNVKIL